MKVLFFANTDWYLYNYRRSLVLGAVQAGYDVVLLSPAGAYGERLRALSCPSQWSLRSLSKSRIASGERSSSNVSSIS